MRDEVDLLGQATNVVVVEVESFAVVDKSYERENSVQQGKKSSPTKVFVEAKAVRALEYSTFDSEYKELENVIDTYLQDVVSMVFEVPFHKFHLLIPDLLDILL